MDARSSRMPSGSARLGALIFGATLLLLCVAGLTARAPISHASGFSPIQITPGTVTPGMKVSITLDVPVAPPAPIPLRLYATRQQPAQTNCPGMEPVTGLSTLTITPPRQSVTAMLAWPAQLGVGTWWFCAIDTDTNSLFSVSDPDQPLLVVTTLPTPTATLPPSTVTIEGTTTTIPTYATLTIDITNWDSSQQLGYALVIADQGPDAGKTPDYALVAQFVALNPPRTLVVSVALNQDVAPGRYHLILTGTPPYPITTPSFTVVADVATATAPATATTAAFPLLPPTVHTTTTGQATPHDAGPPIVPFIVAGLSLLAVALLIVAAVRRRSA